MKSIHENIRKIRLSKGIKQFEIANLLELSQSAYGKIERGESKIDFERLSKIAEYLKEPVEVFIHDNEKDLISLKENPTLDLKKDSNNLPSLKLINALVNTMNSLSENSKFQLNLIQTQNEIMKEFLRIAKRM